MSCINISTKRTLNDLTIVLLYIFGISSLNIIYSIKALIEDLETLRDRVKQLEAERHQDKSESLVTKDEKGEE